MLTEVILPQSFKHTLLSDSDIEKKVIVIDGGDDGNPPICPPEGVTWRLLSVREGIHIHVQDEPDPLRGLTFSRVDGVLPFARLPRKQSLDTIQKFSIKELISALEECEKLKKTPLFRSDCKRIFQIMVSVSCIHVLAFRFRGMREVYSTITLTWTIYLINT